MMKRVTQKNLLKFVELVKEYNETENKNILFKINKYVTDVINKDKRYYTKLKSYNFDDEILKYLL